MFVGGGGGFVPAWAQQGPRPWRGVRARAPHFASPSSPVVKRNGQTSWSNMLVKLGPASLGVALLSWLPGESRRKQRGAWAVRSCWRLRMHAQHPFRWSHTPHRTPHPPQVTPQPPSPTTHTPHPTPHSPQPTHNPCCSVPRPPPVLREGENRFCEFPDFAQR